MSTETNVLVVKDKVQRYLADLVGRVEIDRDGDFTFRHGSARIFISCAERGEDRVIVGLAAPLLNDVPPSAELFRHLALHADDWYFGHLSAHEGDDGAVSIYFTHSLLGDYLDPEELKSAVGAVASVANDLDDELQAKFGGTRFHEDDE